jgi:hypothetical protein
MSLALVSLSLAMVGCGGGGGGEVTAPATPTNPGVITASATTVTFTWTDASSNETGFEVQRAAAGVWGTIGETAANVATYTDTGLTAGTLYSYRVRALGSSSTSGWTTAVEIAPGTVAPTAPTNLRYSDLTPNSVVLSWDDKSSTETSFDLQRQSGAGAWASITSLSPNVTSYADSTVDGNTAYNFRVRAVRYGVGSTFAGPLAVTTPDPGAVGAVIGTVTSFATGLALSGATVTVGSRSATTGADGAFTVTSAPAGAQSITVSASGYTRYTGTVTVVASGTISIGTVALVLSGEGPPPPPF